jgi:hypothetical protein
LTQAQVQQLQAQPALSAAELTEKFQRPPRAIIGTSGSADQQGASGPLERSKVWVLLVLIGLALAAWAALKVLRLIRG